MERAVVCKGDRTTHGGTVLEGNELFLCDGRAIAAKGHMTFCPQCRGKFPIIEGLAFHTAFGHGTVVDKMATGCGAHVASPGTTMFVDDRVDGQAGASDHSPNAGLAAKVEVFSTRFRIVDEQTGEPIAAPALPAPLARWQHLARRDRRRRLATRNASPATNRRASLEWDSDDDASTS